MKSVKVAIEETCVQEFEILVADGDEDNIIDIAVEKYKNGELVLEPGEVQFRKISVVNPRKTEWMEF